jgi:hypothetical protein
MQKRYAIAGTTQGTRVRASGFLNMSVLGDDESV